MKKLTVCLVVLTVFCAAMMVASANYSVDRVRAAIQSLPKAANTDACAKAFDTADSYYDKMSDRFLFFSEPLTDSERQAFLDAKVDYLRVAIKAAVVADQRKDTDGLTRDDVKALVDAAGDRLAEYLTPEQYSLVPNYSDLTELQATYADGAVVEEEAEVQLC